MTVHLIIMQFICFSLLLVLVTTTIGSGCVVPASDDPTIQNAPLPDTDWSIVAYKNKQLQAAANAIAITGTCPQMLLKFSTNNPHKHSLHQRGCSTVHDGQYQKTWYS